jgi:hypothetical protein
VAPLQAALTLAQVHDAAVGVGQHLHLDVPGGGDQSLDEQGVVAERAARLPPGARDGRAQLVRDVHLAHALAAAPRGRLEQHRVPDLLDGQDQLVVGEPGAVRAGDDGHPGLGDRGLRRDLVAHRLDRRRRRADEHDPGLGAGRGERGVLGEEPVAGVDRLRAGRPRRLDDPLHRQVALRGRGRADPHREVGQRDVRGPGVGVGVHGDAADPIRRRVRMTRTAISPRFATSTVSNTGPSPLLRFRKATS